MFQHTNAICFLFDASGWALHPLVKQRCYVPNQEYVERIASKR